MTSALVVSNSSPLIALEKIGQLGLLEKLFTSVVVPPAVVREVGLSVGWPGWLRLQSLAQPAGQSVSGRGLGPGELETIALALQLHAGRVILDDRAARHLAQNLGLPVTGTLGLLLAAKRRGFSSAVRPSLEALVKAGFFIAPNLYQRVLADASESP